MSGGFRMVAVWPLWLHPGLWQFPQPALSRCPQLALGPRRPPTLPGAPRALSQVMASLLRLPLRSPCIKHQPAGIQ